MSEPDSSRPAPSGFARIDAVLDAVAGLDDLPAEDHVAVFESAHDQLRGALDDHSDDVPSDASGDGSDGSGQPMRDESDGRD